MAGDDSNKQTDPAASLPVVGSTAIVAASTAAGAAVVGGPGAGAFAAVVTLLWQVFATKATRTLQERSSRWFEVLLEGDEPSEEVAARVREHIEQDPDAAQVVRDHVRAIDDGAAEALIPALAALAREYVLRGKPRDRFFRNATALLSDLDAAEAPWLLALLERAVEAVSYENVTVLLQRNGTRLTLPDGGPPDAFVRRYEGKAQRAKLCALEGGYELLEMLKHHRIANEPLSGHFGASSGFGTAMLHAPSARRLAAALRSGGIGLPENLEPMGEWKPETE